MEKQEKTRNFTRGRRKETGISHSPFNFLTLKIHNGPRTFNSRFPFSILFLGDGPSRGKQTASLLNTCFYEVNHHLSKTT